MKKNVAVIGYGGMGAGFHCKNLLTSDVAILAGIYDIDPKKRELAASRGVKVYESREELLADYYHFAFLKAHTTVDFHRCKTCLFCLIAVSATVSATESESLFVFITEKAECEKLFSFSKLEGVSLRSYKDKAYIFIPKLTHSTP